MPKKEIKKDKLMKVNGGVNLEKDTMEEDNDPSNLMKAPKKIRWLKKSEQTGDPNAKF